ncbi:hypothetical protein [Nocardia sp. bgisy134]|uniref:hypothetical protein n=1 Tax=unclassified Nocardia TaxID=2637762 RepID=UPI003D760A30
MLCAIEIEPEVRSFLAGLSPTDLARADFAAGLLAAYGPELGEPYCRYLGDGVAFQKTKQRETAQIDRAKMARKLCESAHTEPARLTFDPTGGTES